MGLANAVLNAAQKLAGATDVVGSDSAGSEILPGGHIVPASPGIFNAAADLRTASKVMLDLADTALTVGLTSCTSAFSTLIQRYTNYTREITCSASPAVVLKTNLAWTCDPADKLVDLHMYLPDHPLPGASGQSVILTFQNVNGSANKELFIFDAQYLRQGWNVLRCWGADTVSSTPDTGTLPIGEAHTVVGTGVDWTQPLNYMEISLQNFTGKKVYLCSFRRGHKVKTKVILGFDATAAGNSDYVFRDSVAPLFASRKGPNACGAGYFTYTSIYDRLYYGSANENVKNILYNTYGWDALNHTWNHGGTTPGKTITSTANGISIQVASNVASIFYTAHGYPIGSKFYANISGANQAWINGVVEITATGANVLQYTAVGADGFATTPTALVFDTRMERVINDASALSYNIARNEIQRVWQVMGAFCMHRARHIGAWPNNSMPFLPVTETVCKEVGITCFRGIRSGTVKITDFGVDNPYQLGSVEFGSGSGATTLQYCKDKLAGAIGRGEHIWYYGHYVLDETAVGNEAHAGANLDFPPGSNGNPNPPGSVGAGAGGYWYLGSLRRYLDEALLPAISAGNAEWVLPSAWANSVGLGKY